MEVVVALAITGISLGGLLRLHLSSVAAADKAQAVIQATLLAQSKLAKLPVQEKNLTEPWSGSEQRGAVLFHWKAIVSEERPVGLSTGTKVRRLDVRVWWDHGIGRKQLELGTYLEPTPK